MVILMILWLRFVTYSALQGEPPPNPLKEGEVRCKRDFLEVLMLIIIFFYLKADVGNRFVLLQIELLIKGFNFGYFFGYTVAIIDVVIGIEYFMPCSV